jgi:DNA-binding GntR family transcriptional regulator
VRILPRRGAQITKLTVKEVNDIFEIRACLFGLAARLTALRKDPQVAGRFVEGEVKLAELVKKGADADEYVNMVHRLNLFLAESSDNERLKTMIHSLARQTLRYSRLGLSTDKRRNQSMRNWTRLVEAIRENQPEEAEQAAKKLVNDSRQMAVHLLNSGYSP